MTANDTITLLGCQIDIPAMTSAAERDAHLAVTAKKVRKQLSYQHADLVVLPELSSIDYARASFDCLDQLAEPLTGASFEIWRDVARECGVFISYSFARQDQNGCFICVAIINPDGELIGHYDKLHLAHYGASMEKDYFTRGSHLFTFRVRGFCLAPIICYDIRMPELTRSLVLDHGVDVILHSGAYFRDPSFPSWHAFATTRAIENQVFFMSLNRAGEDYGHSLFCWPWMDDTIAPVIFAETQEDFKFVTLNKGMMRDARRDYAFLHDRLDDYTLPLKSG
ncbi:carbon-nitrogen hydrolase family protein [Candidatus Puniceispirillum sp.]|uniref:carbon-nitrogen hydrolase family protein n=1 Tax=Candidatus Puniceispirillum sp. TaxID=2026719 RepID=UPI003F69987D